MALRIALQDAFVAIQRGRIEMKQSAKKAVILGFVLLECACASIPQSSQLKRAQYSKFQTLQGGELTLDEQEAVSKLCPFGAPQKQSNWDHGFTEYVVRAGYALEHSGDQKIPLWVCERLEPRHLTSEFERKDKFKPDNMLQGPRSELADYKGSGYARGHHAPAEDHAWDAQLLDETFYLSNMSPQVGAFNSGVWSRLEARVRDWAKDSDVTWVITGAMLYDAAEEDPETADGWIKYSTIGAGVTVPTHLFKIVVGHASSGEVQATAFVINNSKPPSPYDMSDFVKSVSWVEERTGFDFFPELEPGEAEALESQPGSVWLP